VSADVSATRRYFVPRPSPYPALMSFSIMLLAIGLGLGVNGYPAGRWFAGVGIILILFALVRWIGKVIAESQSGFYHHWEDRSFRLGMIWFIVSEVVLFATLFGVLFYEREVSLPWLASFDAHFTPWPHFSGAWPSAGPAGKSFSTVYPWGIPALNTLLLVSSGATVTRAHYWLRRDRRDALTFWLALTILLGVIFLVLQAREFYEAYTELGLTLGSGVYGATFFALTGLHGFHVTVGVIMLTALLARILRGHFDASHHFAFEAVSWYWHFVDAVWLLLFVFVYWL
jgi:cytochrome c oxidase subunit III